MENELMKREEEPLSANDIKEQVDLIQDIMKKVMRDKEHYGVIPGCGDKPALLKPGAEKLNLTFRMAPDPETEIIDLGEGHREYRVKCVLRAIRTERTLGAGVGSASTMETKWRFRSGPSEFTGKPVPKEYWDLRKSDPEKALALIGGKGYQTAKNPDIAQWEIVIKGERVEHDNPADYYNTCWKMAKKRALVDAVLTVTAASDIFTQDVEETVENEVTPLKKDKPPVQMPKEKGAEGETPPKGDLISDAQRKRFWAIAKNTKATDDQIKEWLYREYDLEHTQDISKSLYDEICEKVKTVLSDEPGANG